MKNAKNKTIVTETFYGEFSAENLLILREVYGSCVVPTSNGLLSVGDVIDSYAVLLSKVKMDEKATFVVDTYKEVKLSKHNKTWITDKSEVVMTSLGEKHNLLLPNHMLHSTKKVIIGTVFEFGEVIEFNTRVGGNDTVIILFKML